MSAIARMMLKASKQVSGSDSSDSEIIQALKKEGAEIFLDQKAENLNSNKPDLVVYTAAISEDNPELQEARRLGILTKTYSEMLGLISEGKYTIAVSGTHGKTTTTAMVADCLIDAGLEPTVIVGSLLSKNRGNFVAGKSSMFVVEADEYKKNFQYLNPQILVITNIDEDHLDFYKNLADIQNAFAELVAKIPADGYLVCNTSDPHLAPVIEKVSCTVLDYGSISLGDLNLQVPGAHNVENAKAALVVGSALGVDSEQLKKSLENFSGVWRRFEYKGQTKDGALVYDDYAHNPKKVAAVIAGAQEKFPDKKITIVFQPHLYSRTKLLFADFVKALSGADRLIVTEIYAAREQNDPTITGKMLAEAVGRAEYISDFGEIARKLEESATKNDVILIVGAGDVYKISEKIVQK